tara:strand:- start:515 stop:631 length:117 start_codon:yes stop_codon:yes gene_type:complete
MFREKFNTRRYVEKTIGRLQSEVGNKMLITVSGGVDLC